MSSLAVIATVVSFVVGLPGMVDNLKDWRTGIESAQTSEVDWTLWMVLSMAAALVAIAPWVVPVLVGNLRLWWARRKDDGGGDQQETEEPNRVRDLKADPKVERQGPLCYEDQETMLDAGWGIEEAVRDPDVKHVWFALGTGHHFNDLSDQQIKRCINRMVLSKPNADLLGGMYRDMPERLVYAFGNIRTAYRRAKGLGVNVVVSDCLSLHALLVFKKDSAEDWARIQTPLPPKEPAQWPSTVIGRKDHEALFVRVEGAFNLVHNAGEPLVIEAEAEGARPPGSRETVLRLQEVVGHGRAIKLLWEFVEASLLPALTPEPSSLPREKKASFYMAEAIKREVVKPCREAAARWTAASGDEDLDTEAALRAFFEMYKTWQELRSAVEQCRLVLDVAELGHLPGFGDFVMESMAFSERLGTALARDDLYGLRRAIFDHDDENPPAELRFTP